jgi:hypothetical protein
MARHGQSACMTPRGRWPATTFRHGRRGARLPVGGGAVISAELRRLDRQSEHRAPPQGGAAGRDSPAL